MEKSSWTCTVATQLCICIALYVAFNLGHPPNLIRGRSSDVLDFYFLTVRGGGSRPLNQQNNLLKLMDKVSKTFNARFIISVSKLGEADPLMHNGTENFKWLRVPWYTTKASESEAGNYYFQELKIPFGKIMNVTGIDTTLIKDSMVSGPIEDEQFRHIKSSSTNWRIAIGVHPMISCQANKDQIEEDQDFRALNELFLKFRVNVYLSAASHGSIGGLAYTENRRIHQLTQNDDLIPTCRRSSFFSSELVDGLLLHQVTSLKLITYFVNSTGEVVHRSVLRNLGKEVM